MNMSKSKKPMQVTQIYKVQFPLKTMSHKDGHFTLPADICKQLGVTCEDRIRLVVQDLNGAYLFNGIKQLKSGTEIYGPDMKAIKKASQILVTASRLEGIPGYDVTDYQGTEEPGMFP
jgi:hypothetical protein